MQFEYIFWKQELNLLIVAIKISQKSSLQTLYKEMF